MSEAAKTGANPVGSGTYRRRPRQSRAVIGGRADELIAPDALRQAASLAVPGSATKPSGRLIYHVFKGVNLLPWMGE